MPSSCWLCTHCDVTGVVEMMRFVEEKSAVMHIDVIATEIAQSLQDAHPDQADLLTEEYIKEHLARHVVTPVASITRITRDLLDMCETLRPSAATLSQRRRRAAAAPEDGPNKRARKRASGGDDAAENNLGDDVADTPAPVEEVFAIFVALDLSHLFTSHFLALIFCSGVLYRKLACTCVRSDRSCRSTASIPGSSRRPRNRCFFSVVDLLDKSCR